MINGVLMTGMSGFVGKNLSGYLEGSNISVYSLLLRDRGWEENKYPVNVIINLVGKAHDHKGEATEQDFFKVNYELTKELYSYFINSSASLFIHISSIAAIEEENADTVITEDYMPNPKSAYGRSKRKAEEFLQAQRLPDGKKVVILRPTMIHGPGDKGNLTLLYKIISKGIPYPLGAFDNKRSFIGIDNLCFVIFRIIENNERIKSGIYNVTDDKPLSTNDIIKTIGTLSKRKTRILNIPKGLINIMAKGGDFFGLPLNTIRLVKMTSDLVVSNNKIMQALEIEKLPLTAQEGLDKTIKSFIS